MELKDILTMLWASCTYWLFFGIYISFANATIDDYGQKFSFNYLLLILYTLIFIIVFAANSINLMFIISSFILVIGIFKWAILNLMLSIEQSIDSNPNRVTTYIFGFELVSIVLYALVYYKYAELIW